MREVGFFGITPGACRIGSACRDSFRASRRIPMGQTSNAPLEDRLLDPWRCVVRRLFRAMDELNRQRRLSSDSPWSVFSTKRLALFRRSRLRHGVGSRQRGDRFSTLRARSFQPCLGNGYASVVATSLLFGCYHWWAGLGTIVVATMIGILLMLSFSDPTPCGRWLLPII